MAKSKPPFAELIHASTQVRRDTWFTRLEKTKPDVAKNLSEVRTAYHAGEYPGADGSAIYKFAASHFGITISPGQFRRWLNDKV